MKKATTKDTKSTKPRAETLDGRSIFGGEHEGHEGEGMELGSVIGTRKMYDHIPGRRRGGTRKRHES